MEPDEVIIIESRVEQFHMSHCRRFNIGKSPVPCGSADFDI